MDEPTKAKIRKRAASRFWISVIGLLPIAACGVFFFVLAFSHAMTNTQCDLWNTETTLTKAFWQLRDRQQDLIAFEPPLENANEQVWADQIERHLGFSPAIFILKGAELRWLRKPDQLAKGIRHFTELLSDLNVVTWERGERDTVGVFVKAHKYVHEGGFDGWLLMVERAGDNRRWGIVGSYSDVWRALFAQLSIPRKDIWGGRNFAYQLKGDIALPSSDMAGARLTKIRAVLDGQEIFASPGLDTTAFSVQSILIPGWPQVTCYSSGHSDREETVKDTTTFLSVVLILFPLVIIAAIYRWYRDVRRLTEPVS
jgi:hypothetical protein